MAHLYKYIHFQKSIRTSLEHSCGSGMRDLNSCSLTYESTTEPHLSKILHLWSRFEDISLLNFQVISIILYQNKSNIRVYNYT